jgi:hypothetical protein
MDWVAAENPVAGYHPVAMAQSTKAQRIRPAAKAVIIRNGHLLTTVNPFYPKALRPAVRAWGQGGPPRYLSDVN